MRRIPIEALRERAALPRPLYHECGAVLIPAGARLGREEIELLARNGIRKVYDLGGNGEVGVAVPASGVSSLAPAPAARGSGESAGAPALARAADGAAGSALGAAGEPLVALPPEVATFQRERRLLLHRREVERALPRELPAERLVAEPRSALREGPLSELLARGRGGEEPGGARWRERVDLVRPLPPRPERDRQEALARREAQVASLADVYAQLLAGQGGEHTGLLAIARELCRAVLIDPDLLLALCDAGPVDAVGYQRQALEPLARHCWNVAVLVGAAGLQLDLGLEQLVELIYAALLHEVATLEGEQPQRLGERVAAGPAPATAAREELRRCLGVLRRFERLPVGAVAVAVALLGMVPEGGPGHFARLLLAAHAVERFAAAAGGLGHGAVREVAAMAARRELDPGAVRALLKALSLFPVGSWVELSDGGLGRVVRPGGPDSARPLVWRWDGTAGRAGPRAGAGMLLDLAQRPDIRIAPAAAPDGVLDPLLGF
ncbi:MAG: hypothetical protein KatS3mg102_2137 [Planctomycetota bacterium]|nr:MAG: hypothetical protein KatS3mg102_2137 [Planctomycetota bacterium]